MHFCNFRKVTRKGFNYFLLSRLIIAQLIKKEITFTTCKTYCPCRVLPQTVKTRGGTLEAIAYMEENFAEAWKYLVVVRTRLVKDCRKFAGSRISTARSSRESSAHVESVLPICSMIILRQRSPPHY